MSRVVDENQIPQEQVSSFYQGLDYLSKQYDKLPNVVKDKLLNSGMWQYTKSHL